MKFKKHYVYGSAGFYWSDEGERVENKNDRKKCEKYILRELKLFNLIILI